MDSAISNMKSDSLELLSPRSVEASLGNSTNILEEDTYQHHHNHNHNNSIQSQSHFERQSDTKRQHGSLNTFEITTHDRRQGLPLLPGSQELRGEKADSTTFNIRYETNSQQEQDMEILGARQDLALVPKAQQSYNVMMQNPDDSASMDSGCLPFAVDLDLDETENNKLDTPTEDTKHPIQERDSKCLQDDSFLAITKGLDSFPSSSKEAGFFESVTFGLGTIEPLEQERIHGRSELLSQPSHAFVDKSDYFYFSLAIMESTDSTRTEGVNDIDNLPLPTIPSVQGQEHISESMNFSRLMEQADTKSVFLDPSCASYSQLGSNIPMNKSIHNSHGVRQSNFDASATNFQPPVMASHWPQVERLSSKSFQVSLSGNNNFTIREAMDVICNPDLLRLWLESIDALVVTDHKGGTGSKTEYSIFMSSADLESEMLYQETSLDDFGDSVIVPPAIAVRRSHPHPHKSSIDRSRTREEYDGEWIVASTSEIIPPLTHTNMVEGCVRKTRELFGFNQYGSVSMFIERNLDQVSFTVGPYKGGNSLSHKIMVRGLDSDEHGTGLRIIDEVKIVEGGAGMIDDEYEYNKIFCSCLESVKEVLSGWFEYSIDGYVEQTQRSLINLIDLIERGGENSGGCLILSGEHSEEALRMPLLV
jgi:hypothetical protein